ncbi:hypothetical protein CTI12_AA555330 [Artemisia annua]|uniref:Uncharacterized protein n=1 Tax=Artemisia annua TaxID=35608 RepID=A0A2U1KWV8_ARTAN|nr:hypothetical protein CTI12_AA555330 [Artemisia annua]
MKYGGGDLGLSDEIYNSINSNDTTYGLWKDLERQMRGAEVGQRTQQTHTVWNYTAFRAKPNEKIEDPYLPFNKLINEMNCEKLKRTNIELNIQFLQSLQPEWKHFSIAIRQNQDLNKLDINNLFDLLKRNQKKVNEIRENNIVHYNPPSDFEEAKPAESDQSSDALADILQNMILLGLTNSLILLQETYQQQSPYYIRSYCSKQTSISQTKK